MEEMNGRARDRQNERQRALFYGTNGYNQLDQSERRRYFETPPPSCPSIT